MDISQVKKVVVAGGGVLGSQIARKLGRNKSSISREIQRNGWTIVGVSHLCYRASTAQRKTDVRRQACKKRTLLDDPNLRARIVFLICSRHFSPEQIAGRLHLELSYAPVSCSTIYRAIHSGKLDCELPGVQSVRRRLAFARDTYVYLRVEYAGNRSHSG